jgi:hypothetical protein
MKYTIGHYSQADQIATLKEKAAYDFAKELTQWFQSYTQLSYLLGSNVAFFTYFFTFKTARPIYKIPLCIALGW